MDVLRRQILLENSERGLLFELQSIDLAQDPVELFSGIEAIGRACRDPLAHLPFETGYAHHEEFIEVGGGNREEADAFEQWMVLVERLFENTPVELQPGELAIDETVGAVEQIVIRGLRCRLDQRLRLRDLDLGRLRLDGLALRGFAHLVHSRSIPLMGRPVQRPARIDSHR